jgi:hypothetical protein
MSSGRLEQFLRLPQRHDEVWQGGLFRTASWITGEETSNKCGGIAACQAFCGLRLMDRFEMICVDHRNAFLVYNITGNEVSSELPKRGDYG